MAVERLPTPTTTPTTSRSDGYDRGRIRVNEFDAGEVYQALALRVEQLLDIRGEMIDAGLPEVGSFFNLKISALRRAMGEIHRTIREKGWASALETIEAYIDTPVD